MVSRRCPTWNSDPSGMKRRKSAGTVAVITPSAPGAPSVKVAGVMSPVQLWRERSSRASIPISPTICWISGSLEVTPSSGVGSETAGWLQTD
jgi:cytochrome c oxidase assembly factor CtaG